MKKLIVRLILQLTMAETAKAIIVENGDTSVITYFVLRDQTAGTVDTGVTIANIDTYYIEEGALISAKTDLAAHAAGDDAWDATEQGYHMGYGVYRVDWANAAFDGGIGKRVQLIVIDGDGGAFTEIMEVELSPPVDVITVLSATPITLADMEAEAVDALESFNLDKLIAVSTGINADADLTSVIVDKSILSHLMTPAADTSTYNASTDSLEALLTVPFIDIAAGAPGYNVSWFAGLNYLYEAWRNKTVTTGAGEVQLYKNDASTILAETDVSDDGTDFTKGEYGAED